MTTLKRSGNAQKAAASKKHQDVDGTSIKEVQQNKSDAVIKDKKSAKPVPKTPDKEDQVVSWASGGYSVDKKAKK